MYFLSNLATLITRMNQQRKYLIVYIYLIFRQINE